MEMIPVSENLLAQMKQIGYIIQENLLPKEDAVTDNQSNNGI